MRIDYGTTTVGDLMTPAPFTIHRGDLVGDTRDTMLESGVHCVPVVVGIVTSWDLVEEYAPMESIDNAMTTKVETIGSHQHASEAAAAMTSNFIHHLVVVDEENHLVGVLSSLDLLAEGTED